MKASIGLFVVCFYALLSGGSGDDNRFFSSLLDLIEFDYEDHCAKMADARWEELTGNSKGLSTKLESEKLFGIFSKKQANDVRTALKTNVLSQNDELIRRKAKLLMQPGDTLLDTEQWIRLVTFGGTAMNKLRFGTNYDCGTNTNCTLRELHNSLAREQDEDKLKRMKVSWDRNLPNITEYLDKILPLLANASKENSYASVEDYWDGLAEYEGALLKARELWDHIKPVYVKLHKYIAMRLKGIDAVGKPLPAHLFRSLTGDDWSNLIEVLLPKHADIYQKVHANLQLKGLGGQKAYKEAEKLIQVLNLGELDPQTWSESLFNGSCPPVIIDWCSPNKVRVVSCKDVSIGNYLDAHEAAMKIKYKQITAVYSNNTYLLREANRYSAVYESIPGFASLLALSPHALDRTGLYKLEKFNYNPNYHRIVLQLIMALRDLPKLNFYLAADEWRLKILMGTISPSKAAASWSEFRRNFSLIENTDADILGSPYVVSNKPFIGKFMGIILKYQIYHSFAEELQFDDVSDLVKNVAESNARLTEAMMQGYGVMWPDLVSNLLVKRENGLEYTSVVDYYRLLDDYLDNQLDPSGDNDIDEYVEPPTESPETDSNVIPSSAEVETDKKEELATHENILENVIDTGESNSKFAGETSTVAVMEIKNAVGDQSAEVNTKEASYNTYWWIGIAVAVVVIAVLIVIIARKRTNHRKQLDRQRRDNTRA